MKHLLIVIMIVLMAPIIMAEEFVLAGPIWTEVEDDEMGFALHVGYAKKLLGVYLAGSAEFGSDAEIQGEIIKLFQVYKKLSLGISAGTGVNYIDSEVPLEDLIFGSGGFVATYGLSEKLGAWSFYEARTQEDPKIGFGLYLKLE